MDQSGLRRAVRVHVAEGAIVTILARDDDETFVASPEQEAELLSAIAEIESDDSISSEQLLERLRCLT